MLAARMMAKHDPEGTGSISAEAVREMRAVYASCDADGSGTIEYDELRKVLQSASTSPSKSPEATASR